MPRPSSGEGGVHCIAYKQANMVYFLYQYTHAVPHHHRAIYAVYFERQSERFAQQKLCQVLEVRTGCEQNWTKFLSNNYRLDGQPIQQVRC